MKKKITLSSICLCSILFIQAQSFPGFGIVNREELQLKECAFDKEAIAVVLVDEAISNHNDEQNLITERHLRIKILKEKGIKYSDVVISFWRKDGFEVIDQLEGLTINGDVDGNPSVQKIERKSFFTKNVDDKRGEVRFTFPGVKVGSIIEYRYRSIMKHYGGLEDWYFQKEIPVVLSKYYLTILPNAEFAYQVHKKEEYNLNITPNSNTGSIAFEMRNIPGLEDEAYMDAPRDYLQRVTFQLSAIGNGFERKKYTTSWNELTRELMSGPEFGSQLDKDIPGTQDFIKLVKANPVPEEKIRLVYNFVRSNMQWNGYHSKYSSQGVKQAWNKKTGTNGDINLILVNLLRSSDLEAHPVLVSERQHGKVNTQYPFIDQFNTVFAYVKLNNKNYYLDATDKFTPFHIIPFSILNTTGFIVNRKVGGLVSINDESLIYRDNIMVAAKLTDDDKITGEVNLSSVDYARVNHLYQYKKNNEKYLENNFRKTAGVTIDNFVMSNQENDSLELKQQFKFTAPVNSTGDYKFIPLNMFTGLETNPFISTKRFTNVNFGYKQTIFFHASFEIPDSWVIDILPKPIKLVTFDNSIIFIRQLMFDEISKKITARVKIESTKSLYNVDEYPALQEFYKKMFDFLNEQIVLKKKATP